MRFFTYFILSTLAIVLLLVNVDKIKQNVGRPGAETLDLFTNQQRTERMVAKRIDLGAIEDNFELVLNSLADRVKVYPTENYYYFSFLDQGSEIWGNIRLDSIDREEGIVSFAYYQVIPN